MFDKEYTTEEIIAVLQSIRVNLVRDEYILQDIISKELERASIAYKKEHRLAPRCRIDFLVSGGIGIEVKKGKPYTRQVIEQLERYTSSPEITAIILAVERNLDIPKTINGKQCYSFGLNKLWGIAL